PRRVCEVGPHSTGRESSDPLPYWTFSAPFVLPAEVDLVPPRFAAVPAPGKRSTSKAATHRDATRNGAHAWRWGLVPRRVPGGSISDSIGSFAEEEVTPSEAPSTCHISSNARPAGS